MFQTRLKTRYAKKWTQHGPCAVAGYCFYKGSLHIEEKLAGLVSSREFLEQKSASLREMNGSFSFVLCENGRLFAAVDQMRGYPLFYGTGGKHFYISDDPYWVRREVGSSRMDDVSRAEFLAAMYVTGPDTLCSEVKQLQGGEYLTVDATGQSPRVTPVRYFRYIHGDYFNESVTTLFERQEAMVNGVAERLIESLDGKPVLIPLSGGYDSRLLALMLKEHGYDNVICFTYGREGNSEAVVSEAVADKLGYRWLIVPYSNQKMRDWIVSDERLEWSSYSDGLSSLPHIGDPLAMRQMTEGKLIPDDCVVIPGHSGDFLKGTHSVGCAPGLNSGGRREIVETVRRCHYHFQGRGDLGPDIWRKLEDRIARRVASMSMETVEDSLNACDMWDWQERQVKYICNSVRCYEYYGYEWRLPLWDTAMMEFWRRVKFMGEGLALYDTLVARKGNLYGLPPKVRPFRSQTQRRFGKKVLASLGILDYLRGKRNTRNYDRHPLSLYGIVPRAEFKAFARSFEPALKFFAKERVREIEDAWKEERSDVM